MALDLSLLDAVPAAGPASRFLAPLAPASAFEEDPQQPRVEFDEDEEFAALVEDVRQRGILQPLVVRRTSSGVLRIRFGARRYRAAVRAGLAAIPYVETDDERQFDDYAQVAENARRRPLQALELARFITRKLAAGELRRDVAAKLQIDASAVTHLLALTDDPPPLLLELYHSRRCRAPYYLYLLRNLWRQDAVLVGDRLAGSEEIDRRFIEALTLQVEQRVAAGRSSPGATKPPAAAPKAASRVEVAVNGADSAPDGPTVSAHPLLLASYRGRALQLQLRRVPSAEKLAWGRFDDGEEAELPLAELVLVALRHPPLGQR